MRRKKKNSGRNYLRDSFVAAQEVLRKRLELSKVSISHGGVKGAVNEEHFIATLREYLPNRYQVSSGIMLDSDGNSSDQIDVVIFDQQYTPTMLDQRNHRFIPVEAVYAVFEVKPIVNRRNLNYAADKAASVRKLKRTSIDIHHAGGIFPAKPLFPIVAGIIGIDVDWEDGFGPTFLKTYNGLKKDRFLDCGLAVSGHCFLNYGRDTSPTTFVGKGSLAYFLFRFLEQLQNLGTVPAIDWTRYARSLSSRSR
jgi:hypothetical protein